MLHFKQDTVILVMNSQQLLLLSNSQKLIPSQVSPYNYQLSLPGIGGSFQHHRAQKESTELAHTMTFLSEGVKEKDTLLMVSFRPFLYSSFAFSIFFPKTGFLCSFGSCPVTSSCKPGWPWTHRDPPASASRMLGLKACATTVQPHSLFFIFLVISSFHSDEICAF